jgi:hypothetical protein
MLGYGAVKMDTKGYVMSKEQVDAAIAQAFLQFGEAKARFSALEHGLNQAASFLENTAKVLRTNPGSLSFSAEDALGQVKGVTSNSQTIYVLIEDYKKVRDELRELHTTLTNAGKGHLLK